jgi:putative transposase
MFYPAWQAQARRLYRKIQQEFRDEVLDAHLFNTLSEAQGTAETWLEDYNEYRPHDDLAPGKRIPYWVLIR